MEEVVESTTLAVSEVDLARLLAENAALRGQVGDLQARMTEMVESSRARTVRAFHVRFGHPVAHTPAVPAKAQMQFRLKLIAEEFFELLAACEVWPHVVVPHVVVDEAGAKDESEIYASDLVKNAIENDVSGDVDLPELVDAMADLDYVVEGTRAVVGVLGEPIHSAVHAANMGKDPVYVASKDDHHRSPDPKAKPTKSKDWSPPDVAALLRKQGWEQP